MRVQHLVEFTGWESSVHSVDWARVEGELQAPLPADFKELCEVFGGGTFCDSVSFLGDTEGVSFDFLDQWRLAMSVEGAGGSYPVYAPGGIGVVTWASTEWADEYCWLIDARRPGEYPILARDDGGEWCKFEMSTSEFLYRVLSDGNFKPFGIAQYGLDPTFLPARSVEGT
ncbi:SMI1/KNR4 family protein [Streptomyces sp. NPDC057565]|uniref:SMI1/KNR4 family protein n=1 Tax=Streptomyces sp. NPDC057565 TaxID=3346169 RepID=UPI003686401A